MLPRDMLPRQISTCSREMLPRDTDRVADNVDPCSKRATYSFENDSGGQKFN